MADLQSILALTRSYNTTDALAMCTWQKSGVTRFAIADDGELQLPNATASGQGLLLGADAEIYRSAASTLTMPALTLGGAIGGGDQTWSNVGDMTFAAGSILASGAVNGNTLLLRSNDTTFITLTTGATDVCTMNAITMSGTWLASGTVTLPTITMGGNIALNGNWLSGDGGNEGINVSAAGFIGFGITASATSFLYSQKVETLTTDVIRFGLYNDFRWTQTTVANTNGLNGQRSWLTIAGSQNISGAVKNIDNNIYLEGSAGTISNIFGEDIWLDGENSSGTLAVTNFYGIRIQNAIAPAGGLVNQYGLYIANLIAGGTLNRAIYVAGGISEFDGIVQADGGITIASAGQIAGLGTGANGFKLKNLKSAAASALSGTQIDIEIDNNGTPYYFTVYPTKA